MHRPTARSALRFGLFALAAAACAGTQIGYLPMNPAPAALAPRDPASVEIFLAKEPERPYTEIGIIEAQQSGLLRNDPPLEVLAKLRKYAAEQGCDGVILLGANDTVVGEADGGSGYTLTLKGYRASCISYKPEAASAR
jgi:hypothetical protein